MNTIVNGSEGHELLIAFFTRCDLLKKDSDSAFSHYYTSYAHNDSAAIELAKEEIATVNQKYERLYLQEFLKDPNSVIAVYLLNVYTSMNIEKDPTNFDTLFAKLPHSARATSAGKDLEDKIAPILLTAVGKSAPQIIQNDTSGIPVSLSSYRGTYVMVDFWASWCGPCRKEHPNYIAAYNKYSSKGFKIISVSLDEKKSDWLNAISHDKLLWTQVSDLKGMRNNAAVAYGINAIPRNFLIDPAGKIVARDLRGSDLEQILSRLYK